MRHSRAAALALALLLPLPLGALAEEARTFELRYEASLERVPAGAQAVDLWLPLAQDDAQQTIRALHIDGGDGADIVHDPRYGNAALHLRPNAPARVGVTYVVERRAERRSLAAAARAGSSDGAGFARWLGPDKLGGLTATVRGYAAKAIAGRRTPAEKIRAVYDYVWDTMRYDKSGEGWGRGDIQWACDFKRGTAPTTRSSSGWRAHPARFEIGLPLPPARGQGEIAGYHCWARFWLDGVGGSPSCRRRKHPDKGFLRRPDANHTLTIGRDLRFPACAADQHFVKPTPRPTALFPSPRNSPRIFINLLASAACVTDLSLEATASCA